MIKIFNTFKVCHSEALLRLVWTRCLLRRPANHPDEHHYLQHCHWQIIIIKITITIGIVKNKYIKCISDNQCEANEMIINVIIGR